MSVVYTQLILVQESKISFNFITDSVLRDLALLRIKLESCDAYSALDWKLVFHKAIQNRPLQTRTVEIYVRTSGFG